MATIRRTARFFALGIVMAGWMGVLGSFRGVAEGTDGGVGWLIGVAVLVILVLVILMLMDKRVVVR